jgi:pimeloyl-ACP methyl ester carboxylesterase
MPFLQRNGAALYFERADGDPPPLVLIHGWCCDHTYFAPQVEHFTRLGRSVVALDLRGHGRSDKPHQSYTIQAFADDVAWLCDQLHLSKPILIGHSMGGIVALDLAARYPDVPGAIVMLDSAVVLPASARAAIPQFLDRLRRPGYAAALRSFVGAALFLPTDDAARKAQILDGMAAAPQHLMVSAYQGLGAYDASEAQGRLIAPCLYIAANEPSPRSDMNRLRELAPQMFYGQTVGSGHFCQLEVPEQINAMIDRFLAVALTLPVSSLSPAEVGCGPARAG